VPVARNIRGSAFASITETFRGGNFRACFFSGCRKAHLTPEGNG
jgi:hypothetical protein